MKTILDWFYRITNAILMLAITILFFGFFSDSSLQSNLICGFLGWMTGSMVIKLIIFAFDMEDGQ